MGIRSKSMKFNAIFILFLITFSLLIPFLPTTFLPNQSGIENDKILEDPFILESLSTEDIIYSGVGNEISGYSHYERTGTINNLDSTKDLEFFSNNWNVTYTNFTLTNITALDQYVLIQTFTGSDNFFANTNGSTYYMEFKVSNSSYIDKIYLHAKGNWTQTSLSIWNATDDSGAKPDELIYKQEISTPSSPISIGQWLSYDIPYVELDTSLTFNKTYYIAINSTTQLFGQGFLWEYYTDSKDGDQGAAFYSTDQSSFSLQNIDFISNVSIKPLSYYPDPENIELNINNMLVNFTEAPALVKNNLNFSYFEVADGIDVGSFSTYYNVSPSDLNNYTQIDYYINLNELGAHYSQISLLNLTFGVFLNFTNVNLTQANYSIYDKDDFIVGTMIGGFNTTDPSNSVQIILDSSNISNYVNKSSFIKVSFNASSELQNYSICMHEISVSINYQPSYGNWAPNNGVGNWLPINSTHTVYNISTNWPVEFNLIYDLNFRKNFQLIPEFEANSSDELVDWNVTLSNFQFNEYASNKQINFTIPASWNVSNLYNNSLVLNEMYWVNQTSGLNKIVSILSATNSTYRINAKSNNYVQSINIPATAEITSLVNPTVTLKNSISGSNLGLLTFYLDTYYAYNKTASASGALISFEGWYINDPAGNYTVTCKWKNGTEVGVKRAYININFPEGAVWGNGDGRNYIAKSIAGNSGSGNQDYLNLNLETWDILSPNMTIENLTAYNYSKIIEQDFYGISLSLSDTPAMSFNVTDNFTISTIKIEAANPAPFFIGIWNSTGSIDNPIPHKLLKYYIPNTFENNSDWRTFKLTENNSINIKSDLTINDGTYYTYFIGINATSGNWKGSQHTYDGTDDGKDYSIDLSTSFGIDLTLIMEFNPQDYTPTPVDIGLKINNQAIQNDNYWENNSRFNASGSIVQFNVASNWKNISFDVNWNGTLILNGQGLTIYRAQENCDEINWNITIGEINFYPTATNKSINISIPLDWKLLKVFNKYGEFLDTLNYTLAQEIMLVINEPINSQWRITCNSSNYISDLLFYRNDQIIQNATILDAITINATLNKSVNSGNATLNISRNNIKINETSTLITNNVSFEIILDDLYNITTNGTYWFYIFFENGTEIGVKNVSLNIYNKTNLELLTPEASIIRKPGVKQEFIVNYTMKVWNGADWIDEIITNTNGGSVTFYNGSHYLPMQFQNNKWNITLTLSSDVGLFNYKINATKEGTLEKEILLSVQTLNLAGDITSEVADLNIEFIGNYNETNLNFNKTFDPDLNITTNGYNITNTNLTLYNIRKYNTTLLEDSADNQVDIKTKIFVTELNLSAFNDCFINSLSYILRAPNLGLASLTSLNITIYNSTWNDTSLKPEPDSIIFIKNNIAKTVAIQGFGSSIWINHLFDDKELYLNVSHTDNKTFFVSFKGYSALNSTWGYDSSASSYVDYLYTEGNWIELSGDLSFNYSLYELVDASDINLKINGVSTNDTSNYGANWDNDSIRIPDNNGIVTYDITYNKEFSAQNVRFEYNFSTQLRNQTIKSTTTFITNITSSNVEWNSTFYLNLPTSDVNGVVNIIYPNYWELMSVLLESVNYSDAHNSSLGSEMLLTINDVNNLQGNGQWIILFQNSKLVCEFDVWRKQNGDYENITSFEFIGNSEILKMNGSILNAGIGTGNVSVEIWPTDNFPNLLDAPSNALGEFETNDWQLQDYITDDGNCTILFVWTNDTYVTTAYKTILIYNSSRLETLDPDPPILIGENIIEAYDGYEFNITVNFTMYYYNGGSWITIPVPGTGIINYITNSDEISPTNGTLDHVENGKWTKNFTIPNTYSAEGYFIFLNATYPGIENITYNYTIRLVNRTSLEITHQDVPWNDNVTFTLNYTNNADGSGVDPADISIIYESVSPGESGNLIEGINFTVNNIGNGIYNITMNTSIFNAIIYNLTFTINGTSVQTQQKFQLLSVYNRSTSLSLITALPSIYLGNNITIQLQFNDFNKVKGIADASIGFNWTTIVWSWNESTTLGKYFIVIDSSNFNYRGLYSLKFNASLINYTTAEITVILNISKMFASLSAIQAQNGVLDNNVLNISYNQTAHLIVHYNISGSWPQSGNGITGASIIATLNGSSLFYSSITGQAGNYSISVDTSVIQNVITTLTDDMHNYDLLISIERDGYEAKILNLNVKILPLNTSCSRSDSQAQIKIFSNQQLTLSANIFDQFNQKIKSGQGTVFYIIHNQTGQKYSGILNWNAELDTFTNTSSWTDTGLHNGTYNITFNFTSSKDYFYDSSVDILNGLKVYAENETIVSVLTYQVPLTIIENQNIILKAFLKDNQDSLLEDRNINFTITAFFRDGTFERITLTNSTQIGTAMALVNYIIPQWAISIAISMNYYGEFSITPSSISTNIVVTQAIYSLKLQNIPSESRPGQSITYYANLTINGMPAVGYNITFILTFIHVGGDQTTYYKNVTTDSQGIAQFEYVSPATASAVSIYAIYYGGKGFSKDASPISIPLLTDSEIFLRQYGQLIQMIIIGLIICSVVIVVGILAYAKLIRPKRESLTDKKRKLMVQKSETNRELARITTEINQLRQKTINDAKIAKFENRFEDARKLYEKVGNLSLELAEKSVAKEFFSLAKEMAQKEEETKSRSQLIEERNKIIAKAREAIKNHKIDLANKHYQEVIAISRRLKDNDAVQRFSKLIGETTEKVESIKQVNIRKKLGDLLTQANDLMDNQKFSDAASYFEEASYILLTLNEMDGVERYAEWARAARMRSGILTGTGDEWTQQIENKMNMNIKNANELVQKDADEKAIKILYQSSIFALELENKSLFEKLLKEIEKIKEKEKVGAEEFISDDQIKLNNYLKMAKTSEDSGNINASLKYYDKALKTAKIMNDSDKINEISEKIDNLNQRLEKMAESLAKEIAEGDLKREEEIVDEEKDEAEITVKTLKPLPGVKPGSETEPTEPKIKIKTFTKPKIDEEHVGKQEVEKIIDAEISEAKIDVILKIASDSLNNKNYQTASYLYRKAADLSKDIDDMEQFTELNMKSEEIKLLKPSKIKSQRDLRTELAKLVNSIPKFKGPTEKLIKLYENIIETFLLVDEEDAANEYIQKYIDLIRKSD